MQRRQAMLQTSGSAAGSAMIPFAAMRVFVKVVETGSFSEAARQTGQTPSWVSRQIGILEDQLGVRLLNRTTRRLNATEAGLLYYRRARDIVADFDDANLAVSQHEGAPRGTLRLNVPSNFGRLHIAPALGEFIRAYPEIGIDLSMTETVVDLIEDGADMAVRIGKLPDSSLIARKLATQRRIICASPAYLDMHGVPQTPQDLKNHNCLTLKSLSGSMSWRLRGANGAVDIDVSGNLHADTGGALLSAALGGLGIVRPPTWLAGAEIQAGRLVRILPDHEVLPTDIPIQAVYPHNRHLSPKVRAFVDFLLRRFGPVPYWENGV